MNNKDFLKKLETELKISKNSNYTIRNYVRANEQLLDFAGKAPEQITDQDVKNFVAEKLSDKAATSIVLFLSAIKYAHTNILKKDPTAGIKRPKREKKIPVVLTKGEVRKLLDIPKSKKSKLIISLLYAVGLRVSELTNLKIQDLDFDEKIGQIRQAKGRKDRIFNMPDFLLRDLKKHVEQQKEDGQEFLLTGPKGKLSVRNLQKIVSNCAKKAGIKKGVHCHTLRHCFATHLLEDGVDIRMIQELLGHADLSTTQWYSHVSAAQLKKIPSPLDTLMNKPEIKEKSEKQTKIK